MVEWLEKLCRLQQGLQRHDESRKPLEREGSQAGGKDKDKLKTWYTSLRTLWQPEEDLINLVKKLEEVAMSDFSVVLT